MKESKAVVTVLCLVLCAPIALAHSESHHAVDAELMEALEEIEEKIVSLAEAMPEEVLDWEPAEGVRSTRQAIMHTVAANYFFASVLGAEMPEGVDPRALGSSEPEGEELIREIKNSFAFVRNSLMNLDSDDLNEEIDLFGDKKTKRFVVMLILSHGSEHLGQLIAYGRTNDVAPPWSR